ncbi:iron-sulfur cluster biosynthesis family protein [Sciscionella marina]|uniref:iron-sulfur cluster biosynthesis family protein n=1 Tax=Sciscionella marina TaxID=508770 RepID=UPI00037C5978|nr:iron-sulfur cluster biosynthesis family protein [Sciscionella marina]
MLAMTEAAVKAIGALTTQEGQQQGNGLRLAMQNEPEAESQLVLSVAATPEKDDQVLGSNEGAKVFLEPQAARFLDDKVLDVQQDDQGELNFAVMQQSEN